MRLSRRLFIFLIVTPLFIIGCGGGDEPDLIGGGDPSTRVPPPIPSVLKPTQSALPDVPGATLRTDGGARADAGIGSFCWAGVCADHAGPVTNVDPVALPGNESFSVSFEAGTPDARTSAWVSAEDAQPVARPEGLSWSGLMLKLEREPDPAALELPAGAYVLVIHAFWEGRGDVMYGFYVERR